MEEYQPEECVRSLLPIRTLNFRRQNCQRALNLAEKYLGIPAILSPEHLSSLDLDELSCITYLSYFVKKGGPGYQATLENVQKVRGTNCKNSSTLNNLKSLDSSGG